MVTFEEIVDEGPSKERLLDAEAIEEVMSQVSRPTARMHLESLAKKLRRESEALQRMEKSKMMMSQQQQQQQSSSSATAAAAAAAAAADPVQEEGTDSAETNKPGDNNEPPKHEEKKVEESPPPPASSKVPEAPLPRPVTTVAAPAPAAGAATVKYAPIDRFSFDAGGYDAPFVTLYVPLPGVGSIDRNLVTCDFGLSSFDLIVRDLGNKSYRLYKDNLEKDINPDKSKIVIKADKVIIKLAKVKQKYGGYDYWSKLTDKKRTGGGAAGGGKDKDDPQKSIMSMMKDMYDDGDDNMKKIIGESFMKMNQNPDRGLGKSGLDAGMDDDFGGGL